MVRNVWILGTQHTISRQLVLLGCNRVHTRQPKRLVERLGAQSVQYIADFLSLVADNYIGREAFVP